MPCQIYLGEAPLQQAAQQYPEQLGKMVRQLTQHADAILGVDGHRFALQVIFRNGFMSMKDETPPVRGDILFCEFDYNPSQIQFPKEVGVDENKHLAAYCFGVPRRSVQQDIRETPQFQDANGQPSAETYFRRFAFSEMQALATSLPSCANSQPKNIFSSLRRSSRAAPPRHPVAPCSMTCLRVWKWAKPQVYWSGHLTDWPAIRLTVAASSI